MVFAPPAEVTWDLDVQFSLAWEAHEWVADQLSPTARTWRPAALARNSPRRGALVKCTLAGYAAAKEVKDLASASMPDIVVDETGTAARGSACYAGWIDANRAEGIDLEWSRVEKIRSDSAFLDERLNPILVRPLASTA